MRVLLSPAARRDLLDIGAYLWLHAGAKTAARWIERLERKTLSLSESPFIGAADPELGGRRRLVVRPYLVVYRVDEPVQLIRIVRIIHGARDAPALFGLDQD
jgi:plasmid stabilization system protein ParE